MQQLHKFSKQEPFYFISGGINKLTKNFSRKHHAVQYTIFLSHLKRQLFIQSFLCGGSFGGKAP
jgi:hypothetical protein